MLLYTQHTSPRLAFIAEFIGAELFSEGIIITTDERSFLQNPEPGINYSTRRLSAHEFFIEPTGLLFETGIRQQDCSCSEVDFKKAFFLTGGDFSFDVFAAAFFLITRYEEYLPFEPDEFGRFPHSASLAHRENFLDIPLVNYWMQDFKKALSAKFPDLIFRIPSFTFIPSYDIDIAYAYRHKGIIRNTGGLLRDMLHGAWAAVKERIAVLFFQAKDPYDAYEWLDALHLYCRTRAYYFFLVASKSTGVDKNIHPAKKSMRALIAYHAAGGRVGIHPSWQSGDSDELLDEEMATLKEITGKKIVKSRQHFIRMQLPGTYHRLIAAGIREDFSMGYGTHNGFRASVASSFYWYDVSSETKTDLRIYPFCFMDANAFYRQHLTPARAFDELMHYYHAVKQVNGLMITLWHNQFFGTDPLFKGWKEVYEIFLKEEVYWDM